MSQVFNNKLLTLLDTTRICNLIKYADRANRTLDSNAVFCEFGTFRGGSGELLALTCPNRPLYLIDSFQGLPPTNSEKGDSHFQGEFADTSHLDVAGYFHMMYQNVRVIKGFSPSVFEFFDEKTKFIYLHIDVDIYDSCRHAAEFFWPRLMEGGYMLWDDYGFTSCRGAKNYIDEFTAELECKFKGELIDPDGVSSKQYLIIK